MPGLSPPPEEELLDEAEEADDAELLDAELVEPPLVEVDPGSAYDVPADGAQPPVAAVVGRRKSLLPAGITAFYGDFESGDVVDLLAPDGEIVARGFVGHDAPRGHHQHPVGEQQRFGHIMGYEHRRKPEPVVQLAHPPPECVAGHRVERAERFV